MAYDVLVLDSGEWKLADELPAGGWHILVYRHTSDRRNELHIWLPRDSSLGERGYVFRRYWQDGDVRWCVEIPPDPDRLRARREPRNRSRLIRFMAADGRVLWAEAGIAGRLGDFTEVELCRLRASAADGPYTRI